MEIKRIDHYSIRTLDVEASRKFYTDVNKNFFPRRTKRRPGPATRRPRIRPRTKRTPSENRNACDPARDRRRFSFWRTNIASPGYVNGELRGAGVREPSPHRALGHGA